MLVVTSVTLADDTQATNDVCSIVVLDFETHRISPSTAEAFMDSLRRSLEQSDKLTIVGTDSSETYTECYSPDCAITIAQHLGADVAIVGSLTLFGDLLVAQATIVDVYGANVIDNLRVKSTRGNNGLQEVIQQVAREIVAPERKIWTYQAPARDDLGVERISDLSSFTKAISISAGTGLAGRSSYTHRCWNAEDSLLCKQQEGNIQWLASLELLSQLPGTRCSAGFMAGVMSVNWSWLQKYKGHIGYLDQNSGRTNALYAYPKIAYNLYEGRHKRVSAFTGAGFREFEDETGIAKLFGILGISIHVRPTRVDIVYWRSLGSDPVLRNLVTGSIGMEIQL